MIQSNSWAPAVLVGALCMSGCSATKNPERPSTTPRVETLKVAETEVLPSEPSTVANQTEEAPTAGALTVAHVAGTEIDVRELLDLWLFRDSPAVHDTLGELIVSRFTLAEAARLSLRIPDPELDAAYERALVALASEIERVRPGESVDDFLSQRRGIDPEMYRYRLREQSARALIAERVVRSWLLSNEHVIARGIFCNSVEEMNEVEKALEEGAEFEKLARDMALAPGVASDGILPPITRTDSPISRLAFVTPVGQVGGPIEESGQIMLLQVLERPEPIDGNWLDIGKTVELSLEERPVHEVEWLQWEEAMFARYEVDTTPFLELVGEPTD